MKYEFILTFKINTDLMARDGMGCGRADQHRRSYGGPPNVSLMILSTQTRIKTRIFLLLQKWRERGIQNGSYSEACIHRSSFINSPLLPLLLENMEADDHEVNKQRNEFQSPGLPISAGPLETSRGGGWVGTLFPGGPPIRL